MDFDSTITGSIPVSLVVLFVRKIARKGVVIMSFILTDGKNYVMENPMRPGDYLSTTSPVQAKEFTFKQAR